MLFYPKQIWDNAHNKHKITSVILNWYRYFFKNNSFTVNGFDKMNLSSNLRCKILASQKSLKSFTHFFSSGQMWSGQAFVKRSVITTDTNYIPTEKPTLHNSYHFMCFKVINWRQ